MEPNHILTTPALLHVESKVGFPDFVKDASWQSGELDLSAYADTEQRLPIYSKAAAWCSACWCIANPGLVDDSSVLRVKRACEVHGVLDALEGIDQLFGIAKQAVSRPDETYALTVENARDLGIDQDTLNLLPLSTVLDVEDSATELGKAAAAGKLPPEMIRTAAVAIKKAADKFGIKLPSSGVVERLGQDKLADFDKAASLVERRGAVVGAEAMEAYREVVDCLKTAGMEETVVDGLRDLDALHGVTYNFGKLAFQPTPWEIVYSGITDADLTKLASTSVLVADCLVPVEALKALTDRELDMRLSTGASSLAKQARAGDAPHAGKLLADLNETQQLELLDLLMNHVG